MRWVFAAAILVGCYSPSPKEGAPCSVNSECPSPLVCTGGACVREGTPAPDAALTGDCTCEGSTLACPASDTPCVLGCSMMGGAHCVMLTPSNGVAPTTAQALAMPIVIDGTTTFNVDTGRITGDYSRLAGPGVINGIGYEQRNFGAASLGVFSFYSLDVAATSKIQFAGTRSAVFVVARTVTVAGEVDLSGCTAGACAGPGGGDGTVYTARGQGCGGGNGGATDNNTADSGGGGGAGGSNGADGGNDDEDGTLYPGGIGGAACVPETLEPLIGGSGGAGGGPGVLLGSRGGSGGGALQITAFDSIAITGVIDAGGGGGGGGPADPSGLDAGAGGGGGAGGGILLEAPSIVIDGILVANGGGGGGGGGGTAAGSPGQQGTRSATPAAGGQRATQNGNGGAGGAANAAAVAGESVIDANAGGGGGGAGRIRIRAGSLTLTGTTSPAATTATL